MAGPATLHPSHGGGPPAPTVPFAETHIVRAPPTPTLDYESGVTIKVARCASCCVKSCCIPTARGCIVQSEIAEFATAWDTRLMTSLPVQAFYAKHPKSAPWILLIPHLLKGVIKWACVQVVALVALIALPIIALVRQDKRYLKTWSSLLLTAVFLVPMVYYGIDAALHPSLFAANMDTIFTIAKVSLAFFLIGDLPKVFRPQISYGDKQKIALSHLPQAVAFGQKIAADIR